MKTLILLISLCIGCLDSFGQTPLDTKISSDACNCMTSTKNLNEENFLTCLQDAMKKNGELILKECMALYKDTSEQAGYKLGLELYERISVSMIYSCKTYYTLMDTLRYSALVGLDKDSIRHSIINMSNSDKKNWNTDFYTQRGVLYFQIADFNNALKDFDNAIALDKYSLQSIYFKAWVLEINKKYDEAFLLYSDLALLTKKNDFNIFAAIAKQKKKGF
jgi:tetratricopeptide (TPR) repeat protein